MSCLVVSIHRKDENINTLITKIGDPFTVECTYNNLEISPIIHKVGESLNVTTEKKNPILNIRCSILCSVRTEDNLYIKWSLDKLRWTEEENKEGTVKYNTLTSSGEWSLKEVTIEELL